MTDLTRISTHTPLTNIDRRELERAVQDFEDRGGSGVFRPDYAEDYFYLDRAENRSAAVDELVKLVRMSASDSEVDEYVSKHFATTNAFSRHPDNPDALTNLANVVKAAVDVAI